MNSLKWIIQHIKSIGLAALISLATTQPSFAQLQLPGFIEQQGTFNTGGAGSTLGGGAVTAVLQHINNTVYSILNQINQIPTYLTDITQMAKNWNATSDNVNQNANVIGNAQPDFINLGNNYTSTSAQQISLSTSQTLQFLLAGSTNTKNPTYPYQPYDMGFPILLGQPIMPIPGMPATPTGFLAQIAGAQIQAQQQAILDQHAQNYLNYASGTALALPQVNPNWQSSPAKTQYTNFYEASAAVTSYNAYILANLYKQNNTNTARDDLITQATNSNWFTEIATEPLGLVIRQLLMYSSQTYVQLDHMSKIQEQQLGAQAMTNTLLLISNQYVTGQVLSSQAANASPSKT